MAMHGNIEELSFASVIGDRFGRYSKYIIQDRALPDIRDGLKPVQRRILYAMFQDRNTYDNPYRKAAKTVGNVIGNYHPHGDSSVYEAMVRMSQSWKNREPLIDMHGNNGSMDGDPAAAMRYTEARLSKIAMELLRDIQHNTVDYALNFDDSLEEPIVLPARFPNLLVNGATGISAGYATDIPPHNLGEVIDALVHMLQDEKHDLASVMKYIQGPDFPTGAIIQGADELASIYQSGQGRIVMRAKTTVEELRGNKSQIVATELPYDINKTKLIQKIDDIRLQKKIDGIVEVRDESDRNGVRVVIELKRDTDSEPILNYLFLNTDLQMNYNFNMVAINERTPMQVGLLDLLEAYLQHQQIVIRRRTQCQMDADKSRLHIVDGLIRMVSILDEVIATIRQSDSKAHAKENLVNAFEFSMEQAEAIVSLQLYRLTNTDITQLNNERLELNEAIMRFEKILANPKVLNQVLVKELKEIKKTYGTPRLTQIEKTVETLEVEQSLLVAEERVIVSVTKEGYVKRTSLRSFNSSPMTEVGLRELDYLIYAREMSTHDNLVILTNRGNYFFIPVHEIEDVRWKDLGVHLSQQYQLQDQEEVLFAIPATEGIDPLTPEEIQADTREIIMATREGIIKRLMVRDLVTFRSYKTKSAVAMTLKTESDRVATIDINPQDDRVDQLDVVLLTEKGYIIRYPLNTVSIYGLRAQGVIAINLKADDHVVGMQLSDNKATYPQLMLVTTQGMIKRFNLDVIPLANRGNRGVMIVQEKGQRKVENLCLLALNEGTETITILGDTGQMTHFESSSIPLTDRLKGNTQVPNIDKLGKLVAMITNPFKDIEEN